MSGALKRWNGVGWEYPSGQVVNVIQPRLGRRVGAFLRTDQVAGRSYWTGGGGSSIPAPNPGYVSNGTNTYANYRQMHGMVMTASDLRLVYTAACGFEIGLIPNSINVTAAVEYNGVVQPVFFGGKRIVTIDPGGTVVSDPVHMQVPAGATLWTRTFVTPTTNAGSGGVWPLGIGTSGEQSLSGTGTPVDETLPYPYFTTAAGEYTYGPVVILGEPQTIPAIQIVAIGDSIQFGTGDASPPLPLCGAGAWRRAVNDQYGYLGLSMPGEKAFNFVVNSPARMALVTGASHCFYELGINDFANGQTLAQLQANAIAIWQMLVNKGVTGSNGNSGVIAFTLTPETTSSDAFFTTSGQTPQAWESNRVAYNTWLRAGAPIVAGAAVPVGTPGALVAGQGGHPLLMTWDLCPAVETSQNSGIWKVPTRIITDAAVTAGSTTLTSASAPFVSTDVNIEIGIAGAGGTVGTPAGLITPCTYVSPTQVTLSNAAVNTVSGAHAGIGVLTVYGTHPSSIGHALMAGLFNLATMLQ